MTPYLGSIGIGYTMIGIIGGAYGFSQMLLRIPLGVASDRTGKRKAFIILGVSLGALSSFGMYFTKNAYLLLALRFMAGTSASAWVVFTVLFSSYFEKGKLASRISYLMIANHCGVMTSKLLGSALAEKFGHEASFLLGGGFGVAAVILSIFVTEKAPVLDERPSVRKLLGVVKNNNLIKMSCLAVFSQIILFATINTFTPEAASRLGADSMQLGLLSTVATIPAILSALICGALFARRVNIKTLVATSFIMEIVGSLMIPFATGIPVIFIATLISGFGCGLCMTTLLSFCTITVDENRRSAAMGVYQAVYGIGMFIGPVFIGAFVDLIDLSAGFYAAAVVALIGLCLTFLFIKTDSVER